MRSLKQSTAYNLMVFMTDSTDHVSGKAGLTLTLTASKDGAAFASITPTVTERGNGWYSLALTTSHTDTAGDLAIRATGTGADPTDLVCQILPALAEISAIKAKTDNLPAAPAATGDIPSASTVASAVRTELTTELGRIDVAVSTRSAPGTAQTISSNADITAIKAKTDNLPASPAATSDIPTANITAIKAKTDNLPASPAATSDIPTANITAIKAKTDNLPSDPADQSLIIAATDALGTAISGVPAAIGARTIITGLTYDTALHLSAALAGSKISGMVAGQAGTTVVRKYDDSGDLVTATQDANGNRTAMVVTP